MKGIAPSQFLRRVGGTQTIGVNLQRGMNDWDALESKVGRISVIDELFISMSYDITESGTAAYWLTYEVLSAETTSLNFHTRVGREIISGVDGEFLSLQHILGRENLADVLIETGAQDTGTHKLTLWSGTYAFDLEEYPLIVADAGSLQQNRATGGLPTGVPTNSTLTQQLYARGRFLSEAPKRRREWFMIQDASEVHLPRGRYHFIAIMNSKSSNNNLYDGGLTVTGPDFAINNEDGRILQELFCADYADIRAVGAATADNPLALPDNATAFIEDLIQPIYWGGEDSMRWESGVTGPITIRKDDTNDPNMTVYALRCIE